MRFSYGRGLHLPDSDLWLDPRDKRPLAVVSHAHSDHMGRHERVFSSPATAALMHNRGATRTLYHHLEYEAPHELPCGARLSLHAAGHVLGSSQVLMERQGVRLLYSGDFKLRAGLSCEATQVPHADIAIMETTFGLPRYAFPESADVLRDIQSWCREMLNQGRTPVVFCYSLGKGQEVLAGLQGVEFPIYLQAAHFRQAEIYRQFGIAFPDYRLYEPGQELDGVLLCASNCRRSAWFGELRGIATAYVSGWALDSGARYRFGTDEAFPLSDHADYEDLMEYVRLSGARLIYTLHGFAREFAQDLRERGIEAHALREGADVPGLTVKAKRGSRLAREMAGQMRLF